MSPSRSERRNIRDGLDLGALDARVRGVRRSPAASRALDVEGAVRPCIELRSGTKGATSSGASEAALPLEAAPGLVLGGAWYAGRLARRARLSSFGQIQVLHALAALLSLALLGQGGR